jgi:NitT/TauT family transport system substrate-binding protein
MRKTAVVVALLLLAGCGGTPTPLAPAEPFSNSVQVTAAPTRSGAGESPLATPAATSAGAASPLATPARPLTKLTLAMGYIPSVQFAPLYVAQEKGYFKDAGLDVEFRYGTETDLLKLVGTNELQYMLGSGEEVILGRSQGLPVRYIYRWYRKFPVVLFAKASSDIKGPQDLAGKKLGLPGLYGATYVGWEAMVYATKIDPKQVSLQSIGFTQATAVSQGLVDAAMDYVVNGPVQLRLAGQEVVEVPVSNYIDLPSNGIITNDQTIKDKPEQVQALVTAMTRGLRDTLADPDAAFQASLAAVPTAGGDQEKVSRAIFDDSLKLWQASDTDLGVSDPAAWAKAATFMKDMGLIQTPVTPTDLYTNEFVTSK